MPQGFFLNSCFNIFLGEMFWCHCYCMTPPTSLQSSLYFRIPTAEKKERQANKQVKTKPYYDDLPQKQTMTRWNFSSDGTIAKSFLWSMLWICVFVVLRNICETFANIYCMRWKRQRINVKRDGGVKRRVNLDTTACPSAIETGSGDGSIISKHNFHTNYNNS